MNKTVGEYENKGVLERVICVILGVLCLGYIGFFGYVNIAHYTSAMEADVASEALFATVLYENNFIEPDTWYESTARRLISSPNLASLIYPLVGKNMNLAMGISCSILMVALAVVLFLYYRQIGLGIGGGLTALLLVLCLGSISGESEKMLFLFASYYVSHIITLFMILMLYNLSLKDGAVGNAVWIGSLFIAFLNGLQGMHGCLFCYFALIVVEGIRSLRRGRKKNILLWTVVMAVLSFLTSKIFSENSMSTTRNVRHAGEKFFEVVLPLFYRVLNFEKSPVLVWLLVFGAIVGYFWMIVKLFKDDTQENVYLKWSTLVPMVSLALWLFLNTFTTSEAASRYFLSLLIVVAIGDGLLICLAGGLGNVKAGKAIQLFVMAVAIIYGCTTLPNLEKYYVSGDSSFDTEAYKAAAWMMDNGYEYGYSTFDHANYITVMSNDAVKVRAVDNMDVMQGCKWLTDTTWYPPVKSAEGATCYIVTEHLMEDFTKFIDRYQPEVIEAGQAGSYTIYVLDRDYTVWER